MTFKWITEQRIQYALKQIPQIQKSANIRVASIKQLIENRLSQLEAKIEALNSKLKPTNSTAERERKRISKLKKVQGRFF
jgi:hypothetical protein